MTITTKSRMIHMRISMTATGNNHMRPVTAEAMVMVHRMFEKPDPASPDRAEELAREICRELYDRFVMGGWEPQDAHAQIAALLRSRMVERDVKEKAFKLSHEINKRGWVTWEQIYEVFYPNTCDCKPIEFEDGVRHHVDCASRRPLPSAPDTEEAK